MEEKEEIPKEEVDKLIEQQKLTPEEIVKILELLAISKKKNRLECWVKMLSKTTRKAVRLGGSLVVTIPRRYVIKNDIEPGQRFIMISGDLILLVPEGQEHMIDDKEALIKQLLGWGW